MGIDIVEHGAYIIAAEVIIFGILIGLQIYCIYRSERKDK